LAYLFNEAFPVVFGPGKGHGFNIGEQGLAFLCMAIGPIIAFCFYPLQERYYLRRVKENDGKGVPEARMWDGPARSDIYSDQSLLVRLDKLPIRALDRAHHRLVFHLIRHLHCHPEHPQLCGRQLPDLFCFGVGGCDPCEEFVSFRRELEMPCKAL
jgi:hypothetical protein